MIDVRWTFSRSETGTSQVTDGWKLSFILFKSLILAGKASMILILDSELGVRWAGAFNRRDLGTGSVPRIAYTIAVGNEGDLVFN